MYCGVPRMPLGRRASAPDRVEPGGPSSACSRTLTTPGADGFFTSSLPVACLSGGERVRLELALALNQAEPPQLLLLDEPTNHLDLESRRILTDFVHVYPGALIVVSHDERFLSALRIDESIDLDRSHFRLHSWTDDGCRM